MYISQFKLLVIPPRYPLSSPKVTIGHPKPSV
ncbi:hypothetical protein FWCWJBXL_0053 [Klebsiella phage Emom]|uniref:Uncharacterized protein n=1 Tax=Klebsiella phage Emom TaxID=3018529 RepID=A0AAF0D882_9CAUD|nr:hypothetical protein FWCWJBXL_0053 [Klebsiella phage Emom]